MHHRNFSAILILASLSACVTTNPMIEESLPAAEGSSVPLGKAVLVGHITAQPLEIIEDSRCPINARCVWAGRLIVRTAIAADGWSETAPLTMGEAHVTHGIPITLTTARPDPLTSRVIEPEDYRFTFETGR